MVLPSLQMGPLNGGYTWNKETVVDGTIPEEEFFSIPPSLKSWISCADLRRILSTGGEGAWWSGTIFGRLILALQATHLPSANCSHLQTQPASLHACMHSAHGACVPTIIFALCRHGSTHPKDQCPTTFSSMATFWKPLRLRRMWGRYACVGSATSFDATHDFESVLHVVE